MLQYPLNLQFNIATLANDFSIKDASGKTIFYVRQKMFKLVEEVNVYADESKSLEAYTIQANKWLDFSATYTFKRANGTEIGKIARKGWASVWKTRYDIFDASGKQDLLIQEENAWIKVLDALLSEIPLLGIFTGYFFNPSYNVTRSDGTFVAKMKKNPSFFGRKFTIEKGNDFQSGEEERMILGFMMMILMERYRG